MTPLIAKALMPDDLTDDDKAILAELLRETIARDRFGTAVTGHGTAATAKPPAMYAGG